MRADRLVTILLLLQRRERVTAAEVADELEVSVRTARRDLEALAQSGVPLYAQRGRGGGWRLLGGARTDLSGLTDDQARALFLAAGPAASADPALRDALRKLASALPEPFQDVAESAATAQLVDPEGWGRSEGPRPEHLGQLQRAVVDRAVVQLDYRSPSSGPSSRAVEPWGLAAKGSMWYLIAETERGGRLFRVDRVTGCAPTGEHFVRPPGFDLHRAWADITEHIEQYRSRVRAEARVAPGSIGLVRAVLGERITTFGPDVEGWVRVEVAGREPVEVAAMLAGFGRSVVVDHPDEVRVALAAIGDELVTTYAGEQTSPELA